MYGLPFFVALAMAVRNDEEQQDQGNSVRRRRRHRVWVRPWIQRREAVMGSNTLYGLRREMQVFYILHHLESTGRKHYFIPAMMETWLYV